MPPPGCIKIVLRKDRYACCAQFAVDPPVARFIRSPVASACRAAGPGRRQGPAGRHAEADSRHHALFLREIRAARLQGRSHPVREPDGWQECGADRHRRHLHPWHCRVSARRRRRRTDRDRRGRDQPRHGYRRRRQIRHQDHQGSQRQARGDLPGLDTGGGHPRAPQGRGHVDLRHSADPAFVQRHGRRAGPRRYRCLCRRGTRPRNQPCRMAPAG